MLHTLYYPAEVREVAEYGDQPEVKVQKAEVDLAEQFMKQLTAKFDPSQFKDEYQTRVEELVERKAAGSEITVEKPHKKPPAKVINLMDALKESMARHAGSSDSEGKMIQMPSNKSARKSEGSSRKRRAS